jgi:hypothetical protein
VGDPPRHSEIVELLKRQRFLTTDEQRGSNL